MSRNHRLLSLVLLTVLTGCLHREREVAFPLDHAMPAAATLLIEHPDIDPPESDAVLGPELPRTVHDIDAMSYWDLSLEEAVRLALAHSRVLRDLGGAVLRSPDVAASTFDPAIIETDPRLGVEAALSAFDAQLEASLYGENIDRRLNNQFLGNLGFLQGDKDDFDARLYKKTATGSEFAIRHHADFNRDNTPGNQFPGGAFNVTWQAEGRQALLQGNGLWFNRTGGPNAAPGYYPGVLIARTRTDISLAEFEIALRDFVSNVENAYWDLYFSYRDLDAKRRARDTSLETWRRVHALYETSRRGGEAEKEALSREQYYRFEADLQDALAGRPLDGTRTNNGSRPGTFRGLPGVLVNERRLRLLIGLPINDQRLIRPADEPATALVKFDWWAAASESLARRSELRRQRWFVKRRELELLAARNFLLPKLDAVGVYRFRGFGDDLIDPTREGRPRFDNAYMDLTSGDFQEWQTGLEFSMPLGFRQGHAAARNAELRLSRERAVLEAQEREVVHDLSVAVSELNRAHLVMQTNFNRWVASRQQLAAIEAAYADDRVDFFAVLDAQRRFAEAESQNYRSRVEYAMALKNVHFEKGTLLDYTGVQLAEGPWPTKAYADAARREHHRSHPITNHAPTPIISRDTVPPPVRLPVVDE